jgi:hypothetical protein
MLSAWENWGNRKTPTGEERNNNREKSQCLTKVASNLKNVEDENLGFNVKMPIVKNYLVLRPAHIYSNGATWSILFRFIK